MGETKRRQAEAAEAGGRRRRKAEVSGGRWREVETCKQMTEIAFDVIRFE